MRVNRRLRRDDRGAVLIVVAAFLIVAVIFLAFVVDIGNQRQDRRQLTTSTDAAALDVAKRWADESLEPLSGFSEISSDRYDCTAEAADFLSRNRAIDDSYECEAVLINGQLASVRVFSRGTTEYEVGQAVGIDQGTVNSTSTAKIGSSEGGGLRPFAICSRDPDVLAWYIAARTALLADQPIPQPTITVGGPKFLPPECEQNNANWGFVRFATQSSGVGTTGQDALAGTILEGTDDPLSSFDNGDLDYDEERAICANDTDENPTTLYDEQDPVTCVFNDTGGGAWNNANTSAAFDALIANGIEFHLPLYGEIEPIGNGQLTGFPIIAFAEVKLVSYNAGGANGNSVTLQFLGLSAGDCCDVNSGNQKLEICDVGTTSGQVLASFAQECQTFSGTSGPPPVVPPPPPVSTCLFTIAAVNDTVTLTNGSTKVTEQDAIFDVQFAPLAQCGPLSYQARRVQGQTEIFPMSSEAPNAAGVVRIRLPAGTEIQQGTYAVQVLEGTQTKSPTGTLTVEP